MIGKPDLGDARPLYLYGFAEGLSPLPPAVRGIGDKPVRAIGACGVSALVSAAPAGTLCASEANALRHHLVLDVAMGAADVVPARFGTVLAGQETVRLLLATRRGELERAFDRIRGALEYSVRFFCAGPDEAADAGTTLESSRAGLGTASGAPAGASAGGDYLRRKVRAYRQERIALAQGGQWIESVDAFLSPLAREGRTRIQPGRRMLVSIFYLVERGRSGAFESALQALSDRFSDLEILRSGPWPPYSFVEASETTAERVRGAGGHSEHLGLTEDWTGERNVR